MGLDPFESAFCGTGLSETTGIESDGGNEDFSSGFPNDELTGSPAVVT